MTTSTTSTASSASPSTPIVLITGGSRGLGRNAALAAARTGIDVVLTYRQQAAEAQAVVAEITALGRRAVALPLDVGDVRSFEGFAVQLTQALQTHWQRERFDFLVNNAGSHLTAPKPLELRKHEPHPVSTLSTGPQFVLYPQPYRLLGLQESI